MPRVTVVIPTFNRAAFLRRAVDSVLAQTLQDLELFVLDNASADETPEVIAAYDDPRLHYVRRPTNIGHVANTSAAFSTGTAPYVTILHDDEEMLPRNLERKVAVLDADPRVVMVHGGFEIRDMDDQPVAPHRRGGPPAEDYLVGSTSFLRKQLRGPGGVQHVSSVVARRTAVDGDCFRPVDKPADDVALWLRVGSRGRVGYCAETLTVLRAAPGWSTANGYADIVHGRYVPTLYNVQGARDIRARFLAESDLPWTTRLLLAHDGRTWVNRTMISILRRRVPRLQPWSDGWPLLQEAVRLSPSVLLTPRLLLVARRYDHVEQAALPARRSAAPTGV